ncbi:MAG: YIP1 family protein [Thermoflexales bacterium]|nr:YIP1 family protein [Thermoflexales bacterium]
MNELLTFARGVLTLDDATFAAHVKSADALKRGLGIMAAVALLASLFTFVGNVVEGFQPVDMAEIQRQIEQSLEQQRQFNPALQDPEVRKMIEGSISEGIAIGTEISEEPTNLAFLPAWLGNLLQAIGAWLSQPLAWLGGWAWYALWVLLFAKLLGGRATLQRMLGATTLFAVPHVFDIALDLLNLLGRLIPAVSCVFGPLAWLAGLLTFAWGVAVYVKATAVANDFSAGRAFAAAILPLVLVALLTLIGLVVLMIVLSLGSN